MTDKRSESQFDNHNCPACPDTKDYDTVIEGGGPFKNWAKAAKDHAIASHKFDLAAENYLKNR